MALNGWKIFIDPGHGGKDGGASNGTMLEKELTLDIGKRLSSKLLNTYGASTKMSRLDDTLLTLDERIAASNAYGAHIFVSVHINAGGGTGVETWVHDNASSYASSLASNVNNRLASSLSATNRGVKKAPSQRGEDIRVVNPAYNKAWAILPEVLFIDNATDRAKLQDSANLQKAADAIAAGIDAFAASLPPM